MGWAVADIPSQEGRVAVVTGANGGLGLETAKALAAKGAHVVLAARDQAKTADAVETITRSVPEARLTTVPLDLGSLPSVREAAKTILTHHDAIDLLVNNAGVMASPRGAPPTGSKPSWALIIWAIGRSPPSCFLPCWPRPRLGW